MTEWGRGEDERREMEVYKAAVCLTLSIRNNTRTHQPRTGREHLQILKDMQTSEMNVLLAVFCVVNILQLCHGLSGGGECYFNAKASCEHKGHFFDIGESWINDECFQCVCFEPFGVGCCEHGKLPVDYPPWCEAVRKPNSCTVAVVMKANHKLPCLFGGKNRFRASDGLLWKSENDPLY